MCKTKLIEYGNFDHRLQNHWSDLNTVKWILLNQFNNLNEVIEKDYERATVSYVLKQNKSWTVTVKYNEIFH